MGMCACARMWKFTLLSPLPPHYPHANSCMIFFKVHNTNHSYYKYTLLHYSSHAFNIWKAVAMVGPLKSHYTIQEGRENIRRHSCTLSVPPSEPFSPFSWRCCGILTLAFLVSVNGSWLLMCNKTFVAKNMCLSWQTCVCHDKTRLLSWQKYDPCCDKYLLQ